MEHFTSPQSPAAATYRRFVANEYYRIRERLETAEGRKFSDDVERLLERCQKLSSPRREFTFVEGIMKLGSVDEALIRSAA